MKTLIRTLFLLLISFKAFADPQQGPFQFSSQACLKQNGSSYFIIVHVISGVNGPLGGIYLCDNANNIVIPSIFAVPAGGGDDVYFDLTSYPALLNSILTTFPSPFPISVSNSPAVCGVPLNLNIIDCNAATSVNCVGHFTYNVNTEFISTPTQPLNLVQFDDNQYPQLYTGTILGILGGAGGPKCKYPAMKWYKVTDYWDFDGDAVYDLTLNSIDNSILYNTNNMAVQVSNPLSHAPIIHNYPYADEWSVCHRKVIEIGCLTISNGIYTFVPESELYNCQVCTCVKLCTPGIENPLIEGKPGHDEGEHIQSSNISVYPNPAHTEIAVSYALQSKSDAVISICDLTGKVVFSKKLPGTNSINEKIDVTGLVKGIYLVRINTNEGNFSRKVVIE